ncbi:MAG: CBS domain-containing protein [Myxococcales bacterium]|nr:CBS domain-containing protein [Myxococcales bacterium]
MRTDTGPSGEGPQAPPPARRQPLEEAARTPVTEVMTRQVVTVRPELSLDSLIDLMMNRGLSRLPVVDEEGKPIGMVSKTDLVSRRHAEGDTEEAPKLPSAPGVAYRESGFHVHEVPTATVADVMSPAVLSVREDASVAGAAELMAVHHIHGVPVVSPAGKLVGLVSSLDILGWLAGLP